MSDWIVVDVEIQYCINGPEGFGWDDTDKLGVSCAVVYDFNQDRFRVYGPNDVEELRQRLVDADRISGFNIWKFDYPVIWGLPGRSRVGELLLKTDDILRRIWQAQGLNPDTFSRDHAGWGLDAVCESTIQQHKNGHGAEAPKLYQAGKWSKLVDYCINDVKMERDLALFVDRYGYVTRGREKYGCERVALPKWERGF